MPASAGMTAERSFIGSPRRCGSVALAVVYSTSCRNMADRAISRPAVSAWRRTCPGVLLGCVLPLLGWTTTSPAAVSPEVEALIESVDDQAMAIDQLTVAPAGAWVARSLTVESLDQLDQADSSLLRRAASEEGGRLWIGGLPAGLDGDSLRVAGPMVDSEAGVRLE